jgi:hypothetical protein
MTTMKRASTTWLEALPCLIALVLLGNGPAAAQCGGEPPADSRCAPRIVSAAPGAHEVVMDLANATEDLEMACGLNVGQTVWFQLTAQTTGPITFTTCHPATTFDTVVQVWQSSGDCEFPIRLDDYCVDDSGGAACDNGCSAFGSTVTIQAEAGFTYLFQVGAYNDNSGGCPLCLGVLITVCGGDDTPPVVDLTAPPALGCVCQLAEVFGTAHDPEGTFAEWTLSARPAAGGGWTTLASGQFSVVDDFLATWDTTGLNEGYHLLRLEGRNACGLASADVEVVWVDKQFSSLDLNAPAPGSVLGGLVCFDCLAWDHCFDTYTIEFRPAGGGGFMPVDPSTPVYTGSKLNLLCAEWESAGVPDGTYEVKIRGETDCGDWADQAIPVTVDNTPPVAQITFPQSCQTAALPGDVIPVIGTAIDTNLEGWVVQYTGGGTGGWVTIGDGNFNVVDEMLASWDTTGLAACCYTLRLIASDQAIVNCNAAINHRTEHLVSVSVGCPADVTGDGVVDVSDLVQVILEWGECVPPGESRDRMIEVIKHLSGDRGDLPSLDTSR